jgi:hypothetical protein
MYFAIYFCFGLSKYVEHSFANEIFIHIIYNVHHFEKNQVSWMF